MSKSKVYFTNMRATASMNLLQKLHRLIDKAGMGKIDFEGKYTAIKIHFGETGNLAFLRPNYAKVVADYIKEKGGKPFLTDCNTLYVGTRANGLDHMDTAYTNGFSPFSTGCHVIIGDGVKGTDEVLVPINGEYVKQAKIGRAVMDADVFVTLSHFKGHEATGFGGALKNIGMGCGSRAGKKEMHASGKPKVEEAGCIGCGICVKNCAHNAITITNKKAFINQNNCVGCGRCMGACPEQTIHTPDGDNEANDVLNRKIAEYSVAVCQGRPHFHVSLVIDVSPYCDCHGENDVPIIPNIGMFASYDPIALDQACADACLKQPVMPGSRLAEMPQAHKDHFCNNHPTTNWETCLEHGEKLGLGTRKYELYEV